MPGDCLVMVGQGRHAHRPFHRLDRLERQQVEQVLKGGIALRLTDRLTIIKPVRPVGKEPIGYVIQAVIRLQPTLIPGKDLPVSGQKRPEVVLVAPIHPIVVPHADPP